MCNLYQTLTIQKFSGYKVVLKKNNRHYSPATGICYEDYDLMPTQFKQKRLSYNFFSDILNPDALSGFSNEMVGRTTVFARLTDAEKLYEEVASSLISEDSQNESELFFPMVKHATVSGDLMDGFYDGASVVAGRKIKFHKTVFLKTQSEQTVNSEQIAKSGG